MMDRAYGVNLVAMVRLCFDVLKICVYSKKKIECIFFIKTKKSIFSYFYNSMIEINLQVLLYVKIKICNFYIKFKTK